MLLLSYEACSIPEVGKVKKGVEIKVFSRIDDEGGTWRLNEEAQKSETISQWDLLLPVLKSIGWEATIK